MLQSKLYYLTTSAFHSFLFVSWSSLWIIFRLYHLSSYHFSIHCVQVLVWFFSLDQVSPSFGYQMYWNKASWVLEQLSMLELALIITDTDVWQQKYSACWIKHRNTNRYGTWRTHNRLSQCLFTMNLLNVSFKKALIFNVSLHLTITLNRQQWYG